MKTFNFRSNFLVCVGDTHSTDVTLQLLKKIPDGSDVWHCGDGGIGFGDESYAIDNALSWLDMFNKLCINKNINFYHGRGNHDATYPKIWDSEWSNVFPIKDFAYGIFPNGKKSLFIGGGISIDRYIRKVGNDYWVDEVTPTLETVESADYVFSHDAPEEFNHSSYTIPKHWSWYNERDVNLLQDAIDQRKVVGDIVARSGAKLIIGGHFHNTDIGRYNGVEYRCLNINELYSFEAKQEKKS